jgi:hypothetical protein
VEGDVLSDFPFTIIDIAALLNLQVRRRSSNYIYTDCPLCGDNRGKMNLNFEKDVFRCNYCGEYGGMLALYAKVYKITNSEAYREISDALQTGKRSPEYEAQAVKTASLMQHSGLASIDEINKTFSHLFSMLFLSEAHRRNLRNRGLSDEQINRLGYKSTPTYYSCQPLTDKLIQQGCTVQGVPGFYLGDDGKWTVKFSKMTAGMLIPVRGIDGFIRGAQIRLDIPIKNENEDAEKEGAKYLWLSSSNKNMGVTSGSPVHFVGDPFARTVYVTEGSVKADVAHCLMNRSFAAIAGANNIGQLDPVFSTLAHNGTKIIVEAHDMDKYRNEMIDKGASKLYFMAHKYNMESRRLTWNPNYKGIDDWQLALKNKSTAKENIKLNFKDKFLFGLCDIESITDYIEEWQNTPGISASYSLIEYLGLTEQEYDAYLSGVNELKPLLLEQQKQQRFRIYQLEFSDDKQTIPFAFSGIKALHKAGYEQPPASEYRLIYDSGVLCGKMVSVKGILNWLYMKYTGYLPADYPGRSISPSDVIELYNDEKQRYFYRDTENFVEVKFSPALAMHTNVQAQ